jgi:prepilin-type processing-associated H-X9-DG protein
LWAYIKAGKAKVYTCESHRPRQRNDGVSYGVIGNEGLCYGLNNRFDANAFTPKVIANSRMVKRPSRLRYILETDMGRAVYSNPNPGSTTDPATQTPCDALYGIRGWASAAGTALKGDYIERTWHNGSHNLLYFDGHTGNVKWGTVPSRTLYTPEGGQMWMIGGERDSAR